MVPKQHVVAFFLLAALSIARAQCGNFANVEIFANGNSLGTGSTVNYEILYSENKKEVVFSTALGIVLTWRINANDGVIIHDGPSYTQILENKEQKITYTVECNEIKKNIVLNVFATYRVTFSNNVNIAPQDVKRNDKATKPPDPARIGYTFVQWELGGTSYNFNAPVTKNIELIAKWTITNYTISYYLYEGTIIQPAATGYNIESGLITLPSLQERCGYRFDGWFENPDFSGLPVASFTPNKNNLGNKSYYAKWTQGLKAPTSDLLNYTIPSGLIYNAKSISPITATPKSGNKCLISSNIIILYNGSSAIPIDAGDYAISASIAQNENYEAATITLGTLAIAKKNATLSIISATAKDKAYDATKTAEITGISFVETSLLSPDKVSPSDYSINAAFASENAGANIEIELTVIWLDGILHKNYNLAPTPSFTTAASITQATGYLQIKAPEKYEISNPTKPGIISKNSFVKDEDITWEYKRETEDTYSERLPNRVGNWQVRASFPGTDNYTGAEAFANFLVERGSQIISIPFFERDTALSDKQRSYFKTDSCNIKNNIKDSTIKITVELGKILSLDSIPEKPELGEDGFVLYELPLSRFSFFSKPGLDSLVYTLSEESTKYTLLLETPIYFDAVAGKKWNNVLFINNNPLTNGGYEFETYKWFKNGNLVSEMQFYSAGPRSTNTISPNDNIYATMHTKDGNRLSTCEYNLKAKSEVLPVKPALTKQAKQVLGINGKTAKSNSKIYNLKGSKTENTPAGVYIVEENE